LTRPVDRRNNTIVHTHLTLQTLGNKRIVTARCACFKERQNNSDDKSGDGVLNLIQIKDMNFKNACPTV
jgi:hypothetical protein